MCDFKKILLTAAFLLCAPPELFAANADYNAEPPFLPAPVSPNILMTVDVSGSMSWSAYNPTASRTGWCGDAAGCGWTFSGTEEGNWIPDKKYEQSGGIWQETTDAAQACPKRWSDIDSDKTYTGACLNFHFMSRIDLLRWAMVGGRPNACIDGEYTSTDCDASIQCAAPATDCVIHTIYDDKTKVPISRIQEAVIPEFSTATVKPRFGLLFYSDSIKSQKVYVGDYPEGNNADATRPYTYFTRYLNARPVSGGTGTAAAMWESYDYFKQSDDHGFTNDFDMAGTSTKYRDPLYVCDYAKDNCGLVPCAKNFVILATDGQWNLDTSFNGTCSIDTGFTINSADPVVPAYKMHHDVLRSVTSTSGTTYNKKVDAVYGLGLFMAPTGTGTLSLKNTAMYGGYDVAAGGDWPGSLTGYPQGTCTMDDCGAGKGSGCTALPATTAPPAVAPDWDKDQNGVPDTFVNATDGEVLRSSLMTILSDILQRTAAGSSISVLSERATAGSVIHQALFFPTKTLTDATTSYSLDWSGTLNAYWFFNSKTVNNIREDNANALFLDTFDDNVLDFLIDSSGSLSIDYYPTDNFGGLKTPKLGTYTLVDQIHKVFESGEKLRARAASDRVIYGVNESGTLTSFTAANSASFDSLLDPSAVGTDFNACLGNTVTTRSQNIINYLRGTADSFITNGGTGNCRNRQVNNAGDKWKLGDIIHSSPTVIAHANYSMIYVSSNDGMLHAIQAGDIRKDGLSANQQVRLCEKATGDCFNAPNTATSNDIGKEAWAFIPKNAMPYLKYIADPNYKHIYTVDLAPYHIKHGSKEIIIGGMRFGGGTQAVLPPGCTDVATCNLGLSSYFALDVTDPANPIFLWEFSDPGLGFSYSGPAYITRDNDHYVMFGSGPTNYRGEVAGKDLRLFVLKVDSDFKIIDTFKIAGTNTTGYATDASLSSYNNGFTGRMFTNGLDWDNDNNTDLVFFGVNQQTGTVWSGNVLSVGPKTTTDSSGTTYTEPTDKNHGNTGAVTWSLGTVLQSAQEPVTAKVVTGECFGSPMVYFGTGRWFFKDDEPGQNVNDIESLSGISIKDCLEELQHGNNCNINYSHSSTDVCTHIEDDQMGWRIDDLEPKGGFYYKERTITDPTVSDYNIVFFTTTQPSSNACDFGGRSRLWAVNCKSGHNIWTGCPGTNYLVDVPPGSLLLQLSGGNIEDAGMTQSKFTEEGNKATGWMTGIPPESSTPFVPFGSLLNGELILWIER